MSNVQDLIIARFTTLYGDPKTDNIPAFVDEYERCLGHFSAEVLRRAASRVIDDQVFKAWPTPGECRKAAEAAQQMMPKPTPTQAELDKQAEKWPAPTDESKARVLSLKDLAIAALRKNSRGFDDVKPPTNIYRRELTETTKRMLGESGE